MTRQEKMLAKKRGRPAIGQGQQIVVRIHPPQLAALDTWIEKQAEPKPTRAEALRRLSQSALDASSSPSLDQQIANVKDQLAIPDVETGPSPAAGMEALRRGLAENELRTLKEKKRRTKKTK